MANELLLFFDTETGGLDSARASILTAAFVIYDYTAQKALNQLELSIRPNYEHYIVHPRALNTNKVDLIKHFAVSNLPIQCVDMLKDFLYPYFKTERAQMVAHNAPFDVGFLVQMFEDAGKPDVFSQLFSNNTMDTITIAKFLKQAGKLNVDRFSLEHLCRVLGVPPGNHTAIGDTLATVGIFQKMMDLVAA